uniref:HDC00957 n=1 Tax=Drosophila melanogaster TaxID=7227 RepID=Q6IHU1_DROME|nr:TPA_inf: HDC00957 [Drosophila melanogaster]
MDSSNNQRCPAIEWRLEIAMFVPRISNSSAAAGPWLLHALTSWLTSWLTDCRTACIRPGCPAAWVSASTSG